MHHIMMGSVRTCSQVGRWLYSSGLPWFWDVCSCWIVNCVAVTIFLKQLEYRAPKNKKQHRLQVSLDCIWNIFTEIYRVNRMELFITHTAVVYSWFMNANKYIRVCLIIAEPPNIQSDNILQWLLVLFLKEMQNLHYYVDEADSLATKAFRSAVTLSAFSSSYRFMEHPLCASTWAKLLQFLLAKLKVI